MGGQARKGKGWIAWCAAVKERLQTAWEFSKQLDRARLRAALVLVTLGFGMFMIDINFWYRVPVGIALILVGFVSACVAASIEPPEWLTQMNFYAWPWLVALAVLYVAAFLSAVLQPMLGLSLDSSLYAAFLMMLVMAYRADEIVRWFVIISVGKQMATRYEAGKTERVSHTVRKYVYFICLVALAASHLAELGNGALVWSSQVITLVAVFFLALDTYIAAYHKKCIDKEFKQAN